MHFGIGGGQVLWPSGAGWGGGWAGALDIGGAPAWHWRFFIMPMNRWFSLLLYIHIFLHILLHVSRYEELACCELIKTMSIVSYRSYRTQKLMESVAVAPDSFIRVWLQTDGLLKLVLWKTQSIRMLCVEQPEIIQHMLLHTLHMSGLPCSRYFVRLAPFAQCRGILGDPNFSPRLQADHTRWRRTQSITNKGRFTCMGLFYVWNWNIVVVILAAPAHSDIH